MPIDGREQYPERGWSTGKMRMARATGRGMDPGKEYRELEGLRKEKGQRLSQLEGKQPYDAFPEMDPKSAKSAFDKWNQDISDTPVLHEPEDAAGMNAMLDKYGHGFFTAGGKGAQDLLKNLPQDVEVSRVPLKGMFEGTEYPESSRLLYFKKLPKTSEGGGPGPSSGWETG